MKIVAVVVARMTSTRLPGKQLLDLGGKTSLERHFERIKKVSGISSIYLATSTAKENLPLIEEAKRLGMLIYQGAEEDVVERFVSIGELSGADAYVRLGCDRPLFCYELLQEAVDQYVGEDYIYISGKTPVGLGYEILSRKAMAEVHKHYRGTAIAQYIREHPHKFNILPIEVNSVYYRPEYRISLDTPEDYEVVKNIYERLSDEFQIPSTRQVLMFLDDNPEIAIINRDYDDKNVNTYSNKLEDKPVFQVFLTDDGKYIVFDRIGDSVSYNEFVSCVENKPKWFRE